MIVMVGFWSNFQMSMILGMGSTKGSPFLLMTTGLDWSLKMDAYILVTLV
jgi:hypothetical protein